MSKDFRENRKKYGLQFLTMFGIMAVILFFYSNLFLTKGNEIDNQVLLQIASFLFLGFGIFFASTLMDSMREKTTRIAYLTIPASNFEKFISRWLIVTIGYIIAFFIALWLADAVRVTVLSYKFPELDFRLLDFSRLVNTETEYNFRDNAFFSKDFFGFCIGFYALLQSLFILGTTFWEKASFIKTFSAIVVIIFLFICLNRCMIQIADNDIDSFGRKFGNFIGNILNNPSENAIMHFFAYFFGFIALCSWIIAFFRFRESEIINRL